jgi:hypothetical protein
MQVTNTGVFSVSQTISGGAAGDAIEVGMFPYVSVQVKRTGSTNTAAVQISNDKTNWVTARDGGGTAMSAVSDALEVLQAPARYVRCVPSGSTDSFAFTVCAPAG